MLTALDAQPGQAVLEIGTATGWNAALLSRCVGKHGRVITIEVDPRLVHQARHTLTHAGYPGPLIITGDGVAGYPAGAPYDRVISAAAIREVAPPAWLDQLRPGGRLVTPGELIGRMGSCCLELARNGAATGRFSGDLAFMRIRSQRRALYGWQPEGNDVQRAQITTTARRGSDLDKMLNPVRFRMSQRTAMGVA